MTSEQRQLVQDLGDATHNQTGEALYAVLVAHDALQAQLAEARAEVERLRAYNDTPLTALRAIGNTLRDESRSIAARMLAVSSIVERTLFPVESSLTPAPTGDGPQAGAPCVHEVDGGERYCRKCGYDFFTDEGWRRANTPASGEGEGQLRAGDRLKVSLPMAEYLAAERDGIDPMTAVVSEIATMPDGTKDVRMSRVPPDFPWVRPAPPRGAATGDDE